MTIKDGKKWYVPGSGSTIKKNCGPNCQNSQSDSTFKKKLTQSNNNYDFEFNLKWLSFFVKYIVSLNLIKVK